MKGKSRTERTTTLLLSGVPDVTNVTTVHGCVLNHLLVFQVANALPVCMSVCITVDMLDSSGGNTENQATLGVPNKSSVAHSR